MYFFVRRENGPASSCESGKHGVWLPVLQTGNCTWLPLKFFKSTVRPERVSLCQTRSFEFTDPLREVKCITVCCPAHDTTRDAEDGPEILFDGTERVNLQAIRTNNIQLLCAQSKYFEVAVVLTHIPDWQSIHVELRPHGWVISPIGLQGPPQRV